MKQMRSRFRLITLLLVCAFVLTLAVCVIFAVRGEITVGTLVVFTGFIGKLLLRHVALLPEVQQVVPEFHECAFHTDDCT